MYVNPYAYSDFMLFFLHTWNVFLVHSLAIYSNMKYVWTCYNVRKILVVFHCYDNISIFGLSVGKSVYRLARALACAEFREHQKHMSCHRVTVVATQDFLIIFCHSYFMGIYSEWGSRIDNLLVTIIYLSGSNSRVFLIALSWQFTCRVSTPSRESILNDILKSTQREMHLADRYYATIDF